MIFLLSKNQKWNRRKIKKGKKRRNFREKRESFIFAKKDRQILKEMEQKRLKF